MYRVAELIFVEQDGAWATSLRPATSDQPKLTIGTVLVAGMRRWTVSAIYDAPKGFVGARLDGRARLTTGLIVRPTNEAVGDHEYQAAAVLLVRLARAFRAVDLEGVIARCAAAHATGQAGDEVPAVAKTALMAKHLVESGATDEELTRAAIAIGLGDEV